MFVCLITSVLAGNATRRRRTKTAQKRTQKGDSTQERTKRTRKGYKEGAQGKIAERKNHREDKNNTEERITKE